MRSSQLAAVVIVIANVALICAAAPPRDPAELASAPTADVLPALGRDEALRTGWEAYQRGQIDDALDAYQRAVISSPNDASLWYDVGCLHALQRDFDRAREALQRALRLNPRLAPAHDAIGQLAEQAGDLHHAQAWYASATMLEPDHPKFLRHLSRTLLQLNEREAAHRVLSHVLAVVPTDTQARYDVGVLHLKAEAPELAMSEFKVLLQQDPTHVMAWNGLALAYARTGAFDQAVTALNNAKTLQPTNPFTHTNLGVVAAYQQRWDEAGAAWQQTLEQHPDFLPAEENLLTLRAVAPSTAE